MGGSVSYMKTVDELDVDAYMGMWYQIAYTPNWFQNPKAYNVRANYEYDSANQQIQVINSECYGGERKYEEGTAYRPDPMTYPGVFKVCFGHFWVPCGNYYIIHLGPKKLYDTPYGPKVARYSLALVGEPKRKYAWILAREPRISMRDYKRMVRRAIAAGYSENQLVVSKVALGEDKKTGPLADDTTIDPGKKWFLYPAVKSSDND